MMRKLTFLFVLTLSACGLRETSEEYSNPLQGTWKLSYYDCGDTFTELVTKEEYVIPDEKDIQVTFSGSQISYSSVGDCSTSSQGIYLMDYENSVSGTMDIKNVVTGGTTCSEDIDDSGDSKVGTVSIPTTMDGVDTQNRDWFIDEDTDSLYLKNFTNFTGSTNILVCNDNCICRGVFIKQ